MTSQPQLRTLRCGFWEVIRGGAFLMIWRRSPTEAERLWLIIGTNIATTLINQSINLLVMKQSTCDIAVTALTGTTRLKSAYGSPNSIINSIVLSVTIKPNRVPCGITVIQCLLSNLLNFFKLCGKLDTVCGACTSPSPSRSYALQSSVQPQHNDVARYRLL